MSKVIPRASAGIERRILILALLYTALLAFGTSGYELIEGWSFLDSLYMTVITITTVGFNEVHTLSDRGRAFTIVMVVMGVGGFTYALTTVADYLVAGQLGVLLNTRRMKQQIEKLNDHTIVCGFGRVGFQVAGELRRANKPFLIIEEEERAFERAVEADYLAIRGNATNDDVLRSAGIERAKGLLATLGTDAANLMLVLSARALNPNLFIMARANYEATETKLITAGANRVTSPYSISGRRMAQTVLRPNVVDFLDVVMHDEELELWMEDVTVSKTSALHGSAIAKAAIREKTGAYILGLRRGSERFHIAPSPDTVLNADDILVALGTREQLARLLTLTR